MNITTPNKQKKSGARRARQNKTPRRDAIVVKGTTRVLGNIPMSSGVISQAVQINPAALGERAQAFANLFQRFRMKSCTARVCTANPTTSSGNYLMGFADDVGSSITPSGVINLRVHTQQTPIWKSSRLTWTPIDKEKWYYTTSATDTGGDVRFNSQGEFILTSDISILISGDTTTCLASLDLDWVIELEGRSDLSI